MTVGELRKALQRRPAEMPVVMMAGTENKGHITGIWSLREEPVNPRGCVGQRLVLCARSATND